MKTVVTCGLMVRSCRLFHQISHFVKELQQLKINAAETASLVVGSKADKDALCIDTEQIVSQYDGVKKTVKVTAECFEFFIIIFFHFFSFKCITVVAIEMIEPVLLSNIIILVVVVVVVVVAAAAVVNALGGIYYKALVEFHQIYNFGAIGGKDKLRF